MVLCPASRLSPIAEATRCSRLLPKPRSGLCGAASPFVFRPRSTSFGRKSKSTSTLQKCSADDAARHQDNKVRFASLKDDFAMHDRFGIHNPESNSHSHRRSNLSLTRRRALILGAAAGMGAAASLGGIARAAPLVVDVDRGNVRPIPIALPDFVAGSPPDGEPARGISQIITANLRRSGLFAPIDPAAFIERISNTDVQPHFADWQANK